MVVWQCTKDVRASSTTGTHDVCGYVPKTAMKQTTQIMMVHALSDGQVGSGTAPKLQHWHKVLGIWLWSTVDVAIDHGLTCDGSHQDQALPDAV